MTIMLRVTIAALFFGMAAMMYMYPGETKRYISDRYVEFYKYITRALPLLKALVPIGLVASMANWVFQLLGLIMMTGGVIVLLNRKTAIVIFAYLIAIIGTILHMPYAEAGMVTQIRKLVFVFAVFFSMVILVSLPDSIKSASPSAAKDKKE